MKREDFFTIEKENGIATVWLDQKGEKVNTISPAMIGFFTEVFEILEKDPEIKAAVLISRKKDFIAGADIKSFVGEKPGDFEPFIREGHARLAQIEASTKPVVAAIHGTCYGLGTEIALACHARVVSDDSSTKIALPEVKLGLLPGGGGTQRLPRLVGLQKSLDMMLTGKNIYAYPAKKMGLVDVVTNKGKLHSVACQVALKLLQKPIVRKRKRKLLDKFLDGTSIGRNIVFGQAKKQSAKLTMGNYPAVPAIIDCAETGLKKGMKAGFDKEAKLFEALMLGPESRGLRNLFFNMTENKKNPYPDLVKRIERLGILGAGFMGAGITEVSVTKGMDVLLKDIKEETILQARKGIWKGIRKKLKRRSIGKPEAEQTIQRLSSRLDYSGFDKVPIVIEAVLEDMDLKKKIIKEIEENCREDVIIASNTSSLSLTEMAENAKHPELVIGMHYFSPVPKMPLLEIVKTEKTADWVIATCYDIGIRQGKTCVVVNDGPGFYVNRILAPYINECLLMLEEGAKLEFVDFALKKKGFPVGPIQLLDEVGLDVAAHIMVQGIGKFAEMRQGFTVSTGVVDMYKAGYHGKKNGRGFYSYHPKKKKRKGPDSSIYKYFGGGARKEMDLVEVQNRALMLMLNEAVMCLEDGIIANPADGDLAAVFGIGFLPFSGGPFRYIDFLGVKNVVETMDGLEKKFGPKFGAAEMLKNMAATDARFHVRP